jgi:hypothetical protein
LAIDYTKNRAGLTAAQRDAVREAMRLLADEDRERGVAESEEFACSACGRRSPIVGSVVYEGTRLCNRCATGFEMARLNGGPRTCAEWVGGRRRLRLRRH